jgi:ferric-dicitrate binding protein FerR (iron transport regulator)
MKMLNREAIERIERYIKGVSTDEEKAYVESLFAKGKHNDYLKHLLEKDWDILLSDTTLSEVNLSHILDRVHHLIRKNEILKRQKPVQKLIRIYMRAAAILLFPFLITGVLVYNYVGNNGKLLTDRPVVSKIFAPLGSRVAFNLPDGSSGMLNSGSHLSYSLPFSSNRKVILEGEAWFDIVHNEKAPFEISTGNSTVKVLGTRFNISAYPTESYVEVVLQQGKVEFLDNHDKKVTMRPSERLVFQDGNINMSVTDPAKYIAWTQGKLVFRGDGMAEVARRMERWYNIKVELADKDLEKYSFRATFEDDKLEDVLRWLSMTSPIRYNITQRKLLADGTYEKEKVTINKIER